MERADNDGGDEVGEDDEVAPFHPLVALLTVDGCRHTRNHDLAAKASVHIFSVFYRVSKSSCEL